MSELCHGIIGDAEAIRALVSSDTSALTSAQEWQRRATGAAATMHSVVHTLALLIRRADELHPTGAPRIKHALQSSYDRCDQAFNKWQAVRKAWEPFTTEIQNAPPSPLQEPLRDLVVRTKRVISSNPTWTIGNRTPTLPKSPGLACADDRRHAPVILAVEHATEALLVLAEHDLTQIIKAMESGRILTRRQARIGTSYQAAPNTITSKLLTAYHQVIGHASTQFMPLRKAALNTSSPELRPTTSAQITSLMRRRVRSRVDKMYKKLEKSGSKPDKNFDKDKLDANTAASDGRLSGLKRGEANPSASANYRTAQP
ncbi:MAG: hypothetical protein JWQ95_6229 [Sphaerisporangium sp.]|nr:hypothetical protein [Sphaerisporangium sp.]